MIIQSLTTVASRINELEAELAKTKKELSAAWQECATLRACRDTLTETEQRLRNELNQFRSGTGFVRHTHWRNGSAYLPLYFMLVVVAMMCLLAIGVSMKGAHPGKADTNAAENVPLPEYVPAQLRVEELTNAKAIPFATYQTNHVAVAPEAQDYSNTLWAAEQLKRNCNILSNLVIQLAKDDFEQHNWAVTYQQGILPIIEAFDPQAAKKLPRMPETRIRELMDEAKEALR